MEVDFNQVNRVSGGKGDKGVPVNAAVVSVVLAGKPVSLVLRGSDL
jgi:hypothetical protein